MVQTTKKVRGFFTIESVSDHSCYPNSHTLTRQQEEANDVHDYIKERTLKTGQYIIDTRKTVRTIAKEFGVSKSTVHKDLTDRLPELNPTLAKEVKQILEYHKSIRHLRGGEATRRKYQEQSLRG